MDKFITKDIDYTGCHPEIAEQLKQGKAVKVVIDTERQRYNAYVIGYDRTGEHPFLLEDGCAAREIHLVSRTKRVLKDPVSLMKVLIDEGWTFRPTGVWVDKNCKHHFNDWNLCGKELVSWVVYPDSFCMEVEDF